MSKTQQRSVFDPYHVEVDDVFAHQEVQKQDSFLNLATLTGLGVLGIAGFTLLNGVLGGSLIHFLELEPVQAIGTLFGGLLVFLYGTGILRAKGDKKPKKQKISNKTDFSYLNQKVEPVAQSLKSGAKEILTGERKLLRSRNGHISGVCQGIANHFDVDVNIVRLLFLAGAFFGAGVAIPAYIILSVVIPKEPSEIDVWLSEKKIKIRK